MAASEVELVLKCPICLENFTNPKSLPCLHTFCEFCIKSIIASVISDCETENQQRSVCLSCPECRKEHSPPFQNISAEEWAQILPKIFWINQIDEHFSIIKNDINSNDLGRYLSYHIKYFT